MVDFVRTLGTPSTNVQAPTLQTNTGSLGTDILAGAQFLLGVAQTRSKQEALAAQSAEIQAGSKLAQKHLGTLNQLTGAKQSLKARSLQQQAISELSPAAFASYAEALKSTGFKFQVAEEQEAALDLQAQEQKLQSDLIQEGQEIVLASATDASPEMQELYKKYGVDGWTAEEYTELAMIQRGKGAIAQRNAQELANQRAAIGIEQTTTATETQTLINEKLFDIRNSIQIPMALTDKTVASRDASEVALAVDEVKRQVIRKNSEFNKFLTNLTPAQRASVDINQVTSQFNAITQQVTGLMDSIDPVKTNEKMLKLTTQNVLSGLLTTGRMEDQVTALSIVLGVPVDPAIAGQAVKGLQADISGNNPPSLQILNNVVGVQQGTINPEDSATPALINKSNSKNVTDKSQSAAQYTISGTTQALHNPEIFNNVLGIQEQVSASPEAVEFFRQELQNQGLDVRDTLLKQHGNYMEFTLWPSLVQSGVREGLVDIEVTGSGIKGAVQMGEITQQNLEVGSLAASATQRTNQRAITQAMGIVNRMAKTSAALIGVPESDMYEAYAASIRLLAGIELPQEQEEETDVR